MEIKVHEIEGEYYCSVEDIAVAWARYYEQPTSGRNEVKRFFEWSDLYILINSLDEYPHYVEYYGDINAEHTPTRELLKDNTLFYYDEKGGYRLLKNGMYHVAKANFEFIGNPKQVKKILISHIKINNGISDHDAPFYLHRTIKAMDKYEPPVMPADCPELYERDDYYDPYEDAFVIAKATAKDFYITLSDAEIHFSQCENIGFIMPESDESRAERRRREIAFQKTIQEVLNNPPQHIIDAAHADYKAEIGETKPQIVTAYLDRENESHAPLLAVAIDIWERIFIHGEGNQNQGLEPRALALIEKHYPALTTDKAKKNIAYIATAHLGKTEKSQKDENNG